MGQQIRKHMAMVDVEVDETYVGGKRGRGASGKTVVFGMMQRDGDVMTKVVPDAKTKSIRPLILENVKKTAPSIVMNGTPTKPR